jgi:hypothetical protein
MKITISQITQTVIEIDFPDNQEDTVQKPSPRKPFSFFDQRAVGSQLAPSPTDGRSLTSVNNLLQLLEDKFNESFLAQ